MTIASSSATAYGTAKNTAASFDNWMLMPLKDYVIMPSFHLAEKTAQGTYQVRREKTEAREDRSERRQERAERGGERSGGVG